MAALFCGSQAAAAAAAPAPAVVSPSAVKFKVSTDVREVQSGGRQAIPYNVKLGNTSGEAVDVQLLSRVPRFPQGGAVLSDEGGPVAVVAGPATIAYEVRTHETLQCSEGLEPADRAVKLSLPPHSTSNLRLIYHTEGLFLGPAMDLRPTFILTTRFGLNPAVLADGRVARGPAIGIRGRLRARIELNTTPRLLPFSFTRRVQRRLGIRIFGRVFPSTVDRKVRLAAVGPRDRRLRTIATLRTDDHGRFSLARWRPPTAGSWQIYAFAAADSAAAANRLCPIGAHFTG